MSARVVTVTNQKGGVGKTVLCFHIASYIGGEGREIIFHKMVDDKKSGKKRKEYALRHNLLDKKVLVIDLDPQQDASGLFSKYYTGINSYDLLSSDVNIAPSGSGITLVKADERLNDVHLYPNAEEMLNFISGNLEKVASYFDYIIFDTPGTENLLIRSVFVLSDYIIAPIIPVTFSLNGISKLLQMIFGIKKKFNPDLKFLGMVPFKVAGKTQAANDDGGRKKLQEAALYELLKDPKAAPLLLLSADKKLVGVSERQVVEIGIGSGEPVWDQNGADALASTNEFLAVFDAIEHKMGGF